MPDATIDWLLSDRNPAVQYLTRRDLLGQDPSAQPMRELRARINDTSPVADILAALSGGRDEPGYAKYRGTYWTIIFLADLEADGSDPLIARLSAQVLADQLPSGGFAPRRDPRWEIVCLSANLLRALARLGRGDDPRVLVGYRRLAERILPAGGVPCRVMDEHSLLATCKMTLPQTLRAVAAAPATLTGELAELRGWLGAELVRFRVDRYVRPDSRQVHEALWPLRPPGKSWRVFKAEHRAAHPVADDDRQRKLGWSRFGFPSSYNPDTLEALLALAEAQVPAHPRLATALDAVEARRQADGRWRMDRSLNGKMLADVEEKGRPSRWITYRALRVLLHFGRLERSDLGLPALSG